MFERLRRWRRKRALERAARKELARALRDPAMLAGTSLKPHHANRCVFLDFEVQDATSEERSEENAPAVARIWFGILRHPRPYSFSRQSHKVIEQYCYDLRSGNIRIRRGLNLTRRAGRDADD